MPLLDIVPIGPAGAGKSSLLAAMKHGLDEWEPAPAPALRPDPVTALALAEAWRSLRADGVEAPVGGGRPALTDLWFEAVAESGEPLFDARLVDYDGDAVAGEGHPAAKALAARARAADAVLVVVDGRRVAGLLDGDRDGFERDMAGVWKLTASRGKPVRFVVTKWDLVRGRASPARVREALSTIPGFAAALRRSTRSDGAGSAALIPVSVLGDDAGRQAVVPLLSVLPQVLRTAAGHPGHPSGKKGSLVAGVGANWLSQAVTAVAVRQVLQRLVDTVPERRAARRCAGHAAVGVAMLVEAAVRTWCDRATRPADDGDSRARGKALTRAADAYEWQLREFRRLHPEADLSAAPSPGLLRRLIG
ncbi:hypothetical protein ACIQMJ_39285 [Actinosynnema sp. NPDC091369]